MENCSICSTKLKFSNTPNFNSGRLIDGSVICRSCYKQVSSRNPQIALDLKSRSKEEILQFIGDNKPIVISQKQKVQVFAFLTVAILFLWIFISNLGEKSLDEKYTKRSALLDSRQFVLQELKTPSTAEFSFEHENSVRKINDTIFFVYGYVDSENSFGAKLRASYTCTITYLNSIDKIQCDNLIIK